MTRYLIPMMLAVLLGGCGLGGTASTAASVAESEAESAKAAKEAQARIEKQLDEAQKAAADQRKAAEDASQ